MDSDDVQLVAERLAYERVPNPLDIVDLSDSDLKEDPPRKRPNNFQMTNQNRCSCECVICLEPFTSDGEHRIVTTKCGHLFGQSCIIQALTSKGICPTCRTKCRKRDLIHLYTSNIIAVDTSVLDKLNAELVQQRHKALKQRETIIEMNEALVLSRKREEQHEKILQQQAAEIMRLRGGENLGQPCLNSGLPYPPTKLDGGKQRPSSAMECPVLMVSHAERHSSASQGDDHTHSSGGLSTEPARSSIESTNALASLWTLPLRGGRLLRSQGPDSLLVASQADLESESSSHSYIIRKISAADSQLSCHVGGVSDIPRDMSVGRVGPQTDLVAVATDRAVQLLSQRAGKSVMTVPAGDSPPQVWSCTWSRSPYSLWLGLGSGTALLFDIRLPRTPVSALAMEHTAAASGQPVLSLCSVCCDSDVVLMAVQGGRLWALSEGALPPDAVQSLRPGRCSRVPMMLLDFSGGGGRSIFDGIPYVVTESNEAMDPPSGQALLCTRAKGANGFGRLSLLSLSTSPQALSATAVSALDTRAGLRVTVAGLFAGHDVGFNRVRGASWSLPHWGSAAVCPDASGALCLWRSKHDDFCVASHRIAMPLHRDPVLQTCLLPSPPSSRSSQGNSALQTPLVAAMSASSLTLHRWVAD